MTEREKMVSGALYYPGDKELAEARDACKALCQQFNQLVYRDMGAACAALNAALPHAGQGFWMEPPFWCDYGYNISVGDYFYANHNLVVTDGAKVTFGDNVFIAPNCCFTTAEHAIDPEQRKAGMEVAKPIVVGNNVWIGAGSTILAGVTIGDNTVIGAGSVVKKSIPANVVAVGVPCRVLREITEEDRRRYPVWQHS